MGKETNKILPITTDIKLLIDQSRQNVAYTVNAEITLLYWKVGRRTNEEILKNDRAEYGKQIIESISQQLTHYYGSGWSKRQLHYCLRTAEIFPEIEIVHALRSQLSWTQLRFNIPIEDKLKREFYLEMSRLEKCSSRQLQERIQSMLYERTAIGKRSEET